MLPEQKKLVKTRAVCAMAAFATLASIYAGVELTHTAARQQESLERQWPGIEWTPAVVNDGWKESGGNGANPPQWIGMEDSGRWAALAIEAPGPGAAVSANTWSGVRVGVVGQAVEIDVQGQIAASPATSRHWSTYDMTGWDAQTNSATYQTNYHTEFVPASGFRAAEINGSLISNVNKDAAQRQSKDPADQPDSALLARSSDLPRVAAGELSPALAAAPAMGRIVAPAVVGDAQVVWAYAQKTGLNGDGQSEVVIRSGYAPLAAVNAFHAADRKSDLLGGGAALLFTLAFFSSITALFAFATQKELKEEVDGVKRRLVAQRAEKSASRPDPAPRNDPGRWV